jgi:ribonucleoside-diphosphate reductase alpha chain
LDCSHPDIFEFIRAKSQPQALTHFNLSVAISDAFMRALTADDEWPLHYAGATVESVPASDIWEALVACNQQGGEPGVLFIDRINAGNRLRSRETIRATNPCGELPLPPHGSCVLGSLVLTSFVEKPFTSDAHINRPLLENSTRIAVRMLDNVLDLAELPLQKQRDIAYRTRRIGLGVTGLADALILLGLPYDSEKARRAAVNIFSIIRDAAYASSSELAHEKGAFPAFNASNWLNNPIAAPLSPEISRSIRTQGLRNGNITAIAPAGSISFLPGNVSSGIEPVFDRTYNRTLKTANGVNTVSLTDFAVQKWRKLQLRTDVPLAFRSVATISPADQIAMAAAIQPYIDGAISKTVAMSAGASAEAISACYLQAYNTGLKGITCYPAQTRRGCVMKSDTEAVSG